jgi:hypothetical protein
MIFCAETSFLFSLYGADVNTAAAQEFVTDRKTALNPDSEVKQRF